MDTSESLRIGAADGDDRYLITRPMTFQTLSDGRFVLGEVFGTVRIFDRDGTFVRQIGRRGRGPGEFDQLVRVLITPGETIVTHDQTGARIIHFDTAGTVVREYALDSQIAGRLVSLTGRLPDGELVGWVGQPITGSGGESELPTSSHTFLFAPSGTLVDSLGDLPGWTMLVSGSATEFSSIGALVSRSAISAVVGDQLVIADNQSPEIALYVKSPPADSVMNAAYATRRGPFHLHGVITGPPVAPALSSTDVDTLLSRQIGWMEEGAAKARLADRLRATARPEQIPYYAAILGDAAGNIWVRQFTSPAEGARNYVVSSSRGEHLGVAEFPAAFAVTEIGRDYVLGIERDENDVPYAVRRGLRRR